MKKVKVMLAAFAIVALVSGALSVKAKNAYTSVIFTSTNEGLTCDQLTLASRIVEEQAGTGVYASITPSTGCPEVLTAFDL